MRTIAEKWSEFEGIALRGAGVPEIQRSEMQKSFYAGAQAVLYIMWLIGGDENVGEDAGAQIIEGLHQECNAFARGMIPTKAGAAVAEAFGFAEHSRGRKQ